MSQWKRVKDREKYGIAIHNFSEDATQRLKLTVGEAVHILEENGDWYFGYLATNRSLRGIFPKSYVHLLDVVVDRSGPIEVVSTKQPSVVQEITSVLREWGQIWKHLYVTHNENFETIKNRIYELIGYRSKILSGTLPIDELKEIKRLVTSKIDMGNKLLDLDMVVRDEQGNILNPDVTSTVQLYYQHKIATERIKRESSAVERKPVRVATHYSHIFFVCVRNFVCKMNEDAQLLITLYDSRESRAVTENYVVRWSREGLVCEIDQLHNLKVLFTDLGSKDLHRDRVYLVCYVVRVGAMETREADHRRSSHVPRKPQPDAVRRPFGVAAMDVTPYLSGRLDSDEEKQHFIPFLQCCEGDNLDGTLRRILTLKELSQKDHKGNGLYTSFRLLHGDLKQVREENPHLVLGNMAVARKMGFPEVILPGDVRNDLYLTLVSGEFSKGSKSTDKNVQVTVTVCSEKGHSIPGVISLGGGAEPMNEYKSVVYYHEDKPRWQEIFKVAVPIEEFKGSHLKFRFKHRSSNEAKDKSEKPFAMSYVKLMQNNGTTLWDSQHELLVYKIDHKKFDESDLGYLTLPSTRSEVVVGQKPQLGGLSLSSKDSFTIHTNVCSTKLTQNVDLLGLLNWAGRPAGLVDSLTALMKVDGEEVVKFLQDVLDALFSILMQNSDSDLYDNMVFECLLYIIGLVSDRKYQHFQPVLDLYIKESFSATLAYSKLMVVLKCHIDNAPALSLSADPKDNLLLRTMKSIQYCMRFIVRSRLLFSELNEGKGQQQFEAQLRQLLQSITGLMCYDTDHTLAVQGACLKYLPSVIPDVLLVFNCTQLSALLTDLVNKMPPGRLTKQKMAMIDDVVHSQLFLCSDCRAVLLPVVTVRVKELLDARDEQGYGGVEFRNKDKSVAKVAKVLGEAKHTLHSHRGYSEEMELCVKILSDIMDLLFRMDIGPTIHDITEIMLTVLRTIIQTTISMDRESPLVGNLIAVMVAVFRQMTAHHFERYITHFMTSTDLLDFLMEILLVFKDLVSRPVFPRDWCEMIMLQNCVILKSLRFFSHTIRDYFFKPFEIQAWNNFFHCAIAFLTQPALQLETFSQNKRSHIIGRYKDMRRETGFEIRAMWYNLGQNKIFFVPGLVGSFLEMTLIPETELRKATIPMFFDMMQCEFYSSRFGEGYGDTKRDSTHIKANFSEFENEMIAKLDILVEGGRGDGQYKELFFSIMMSQCDKHCTMREQGIKFVKTVTRLMERLLEYRSIITDENKENRMSCTVNLLDFYSEINRKEMYIRYVNKLCDLHLECDNYTEAACTLRLHSKLLNWSDAVLPPLLRSNKFPLCQTHRQLKEALYYSIIDHFDKGKMWECALSVCQELMEQYKEETFDYIQLSALHKRMSQFYDNIMKQIRPKPEYFRVAFYGRGFPPFLQNKVFVYRGKEYERLSDFSNRTLNQLPNAERMGKLNPPGEEITESPHQYVQINSVEPLMDERKQRLSGKPVCDQILRYHRVNDVQKFRFSRPFHRRDLEVSADADNEFGSLWLERTVLVTSYPLPGILRWFPVTSTETYLVSPLRNAIETMEATNKALRDLVVAHSSDPSLQLNPLSMKINGIVDAAVMGGITNYEKAFFTPEYEEAHPDEAGSIARLKELIASQIPLLDLAVQLHKRRAPPSLLPLQKRLEECFGEMRAHVEDHYGKKTTDLKLEVPYRYSPRRQFSAGNVEDNRLSDLSMTPSEAASFAQSPGKSATASPAVSLRSGSVFSKSGGGAGTPKGSMKREKNKDKRRGSKSKGEAEGAPAGPQSPSKGSTWYTSTFEQEAPSWPSLQASAATMVFELSQQLTSTRPLRSEVEREKRLSRPPSGQFTAGRLVSTTSIRLNGSGSNRDSIGTTDSTASEEDGAPPPLPQKNRDADYCNLPGDDDAENEPARPPTVPKIRHKPPCPPEPLEHGLPPTPPPKRAVLKSPQL
ncbi:dedicator of cytokinesis protein 1 isoform X3 [Bacillus rossius redtenbacheri]|uniref:dedicator of cytokinesis protein 1 isoform X3 n=1 Tax=Bacillus rossius redtenbacheri TaxID=93214 RepID=UPI002FDEDA3F